MKNEIIKDDYQVVAHCGNYEPYAAGYRDGIAIGENKAIEKFIEYLDNNAFELRHDMAIIRDFAKRYKGNKR